MSDPQAPLFRKRYRIPSARLKAWDYRRPGMYFVTICTWERDRCLGEVIGGQMAASIYGEIVTREWQRIPGRQPRVDLDTWIVMPDHLHGILMLKPTPEKSAQSLGMIVGEFKSKATKAIRLSGYRDFDWQERFHDHIIRNLEELEKIRTYILQNPQRWEINQTSSPERPSSLVVTTFRRDDPDPIRHPCGVHGDVGSSPDRRPSACPEALVSKGSSK